MKLKFPITIAAALLTGSAAFAATATQTVSGADGAVITFTRSATELTIEYRAPGVSDSCGVYALFGTQREIGSAVVPFQQSKEGSTVFLPFKADLFVSAKADLVREQNWKRWK
jgi:hypothetical protein